MNTTMSDTADVEENVYRMPNEKAESAENVRLPNDTKIRFCNAVDGMKAHCILCKECDIYMRWGDGDLCSAGKTIIAMELCYADTKVEFPPNAKRIQP